MTVRPTLAIVGASLAGAKAAEAARAAGYDGRIMLIGEEPSRPYERPPLSKAVLRGEKKIESARVHEETFYNDHEIELVVDRATSFDFGARNVMLAGGDRIRFDTAVLATGATPRRLDVPGADLAGVHHLRTMDDAVRLRDAVRGATRIAVIGAGWIGSEVAASAREMGAEVVLVDPAPVPLQRVLGDHIGAVFGRLHADHDVSLRLGTGITELRGTKTIEALVLDDGSLEEADLVVVGIGVTPRVELVEQESAVRVDNGIVVDQHLETGAAGIYAAGDVANAWHPHYERHIRVEHWANAVHQGTMAGRNAAGSRETYRRLPYFFSDQYDLGMEYVGYGSTNDEVLVRGDLDSREFIAFWRSDGVVTAAMNVNIWDVAQDLEAIVESRAAIDAGRLCDPDVPLADLS